MTGQIEKKARAVFEENPAVKLAYLFGSRADGSAGPMSDYDFAVYLDEPDALKRFDLRLDIAGKLSDALKTDAVDLVVINDADAPELKFHIINEGKLVFEREPFKVLVEPRILVEYADFRALLRRYHLTQA